MLSRFANVIYYFFAGISVLAFLAGASTGYENYLANQKEIAQVVSRPAALKGARDEAVDKLTAEGVDPDKTCGPWLRYNRFADQTPHYAECAPILAYLSAVDEASKTKSAIKVIGEPLEVGAIAAGVLLLLGFVTRYILTGRTDLK